MVGIHGIDGIGKTELALALALYNLITDNFKDIRQERIQIIGVKEGISQIQRRLSRIKVLLVLDDVDEHEQWIAIAEKSDWFHLVSRIIITTQDKYLPTPHDNERTYKIQGFNLFGKDLELQKSAMDLYEKVSFDALGEDVQSVIIYEKLQIYFKLIMGVV
ncbi:hypothetical protein AHAS_Ahas05G0193400 [Arachis hypogaea]